MIKSVNDLEVYTYSLELLKNDGDKLIEKYIILSKRLNKLHQVWKSDKF